MNLALQAEAASPLALAEATRARNRIAARMRRLLEGEEGGVYELVAYHLGWRDERGRALDRVSGKLLRPSVCLMAAEGFGASPEEGVLEAACAIEFLHAFSLAHDDIEDGDEQRRHRPTLWVLHGVPLAINAGDCLFALAFRTLADAVAALPAERARRTVRLFGDAALLMIEGQHDDLAFESQAAIALDAYEAMAARKTGALIAASLAIGSLFGDADDGDVEALLAAGRAAGLAFQVIDDALAIWGDAAATGKPAKNDLARGKKSLPVVLANELGCAPDEPTVRRQCFAIAAEHAGAARELIRSTAMSAEAKSRLLAVIDFVLERES
jgi:geranylgeranyl diphosphate synthase type I